jgi:hypothetical protein
VALRASESVGEHDRLARCQQPLLDSGSAYRFHLPALAWCTASAGGAVHNSDVARSGEAVRRYLWCSGTGVAAASTSQEQRDDREGECEELAHRSPVPSSKTICESNLRYREPPIPTARAVDSTTPSMSDSVLQSFLLI